MADDQKPKAKPARERRLSLHPLTVEDALRGAMATGKPPEPPKSKRTATKRRLKGEDEKRVRKSGD